MLILTPGHRYVAANHEDPAGGQTIQFIEKKPVEEGGTIFKTVSDGTTSEELMRILIDRLTHMQKAIPCKENACTITHLEEGLMWLEKRTRDRMSRSVEGTNKV